MDHDLTARAIDAGRARGRRDRGPHLDIAGATDVGRRREINQDQFLIADLGTVLDVSQTSLKLSGQHTLLGRTLGCLLAVADGMGGHAHGERASAIALDTVVHYTLDALPVFREAGREDARAIEDALARLAEECEADIQLEAKANPENARMGTTLTLGYLMGRRLYLVHVGDSRAYVLRGGNLQQLTRDHTVAQQLVEEGILTPEQRKTSRMDHVLTNALGGDPETGVVPETHTVELEPGDVLLLCTDGLTKHLDDAQIAEAIRRSGSSSEACKRLIEEANAGGGTDNVAAVVARLNA